jgi:hypothetical protein
MMLTVCLSSVILSTAEGQMLPGMITPIVAIAAWLLVDHHRLVSLPTWAANILGFVAVGVVSFEFVNDGLEAKVLAGSHFLIYLTWIVVCVSKTNRQYWWILALNLLQLAVAAVLTSSAGFGASLIGMLILLLWTLSVFSLYRVQTGAYPAGTRLMSGENRALASVITVRNGIQRDADEPWISWRFRGLVTLSFVASLAVGAAVFAAFPRVWVSASPFSSTVNPDERRPGIVHRTGFTDTVTLGEFGQMLQSDSRVLHFTVADIETGRPVNPEVLETALSMDELRFRGNAMSYYSKGSWSRFFSPTGLGRRGGGGELFNGTDSLKARFRLHISQDPPASQFAFAPYPICKAVADPGAGAIRYRSSTSTLSWSAGEGDFDDIVPTAPRSFQVDCPEVRDPDDLNFSLWRIPDSAGVVLRSRMYQRFRRSAEEIFIPRHLQAELPGLYSLSRQLCADDSSGNLVSQSERIARVMRFLSRENGFQYSLSVSRKDTTIDPLEDFVQNTKKGHCEYFASACTLMLQCVDVPARLVNGFSGFEKNTVSGSYEVKQRHAHAWTEAFVDGRWKTLEPTPASERESTVAEAADTGFLGDLHSAVSDFWSDGINSMTLQKQQSLFDPVMTMFTNLKVSIQQKGLVATVIESFSALVDSAGAAGWGALLLLAISVPAAALLMRRRGATRIQELLNRLRQRFSRARRSSQSVIRFYATFCSVCASHGLRFSESGTAVENAERAIQFFGQRLTSAGLQSLPLHIASAFNEIRFGDTTLSEERMATIREELETFTRALKESARKTTSAVAGNPAPSGSSVTAAST